MAIKRGSKVEKSFSAASMTDLMFLLLMFMLIASTMINPNAVRVLLPKSANQLTDRPYITVSIDRNLNYYVGLQPVSFDRLESTLKAGVTGIENPIVSLNPDETVPFSEFIKVINIAKDNNFTLILATRPK